jgi:hypothetical protein
MAKFNLEISLFGLELNLGAGLGTKKARRAIKEQTKRSMKAADKMIDVTSEVVKDTRDVVAKGAKGTIEATRTHLGLDESE